MKTILFLLSLILFSNQLTAQSAIKSWKIEELQKYIAESKEPVIVNFWATFCKPCIEEIPWFEEVVEKYRDKNVKLLLVSLDFPAFYPTILSNFVKKQNYSAEVIWLNEMDADKFCPKIDSSWSGAIPATLFVNNKTGYRKFVVQQMRPAYFESRIKDALE